MDQTGKKKKNQEAQVLWESAVTENSVKPSAATVAQG